MKKYVALMIFLVLSVFMKSCKIENTKLNTDVKDNESQEVAEVEPVNQLVVFGGNLITSHTATISKHMDGIEIKALSDEPTAYLDVNEIVPKLISGDDSFDIFLLSSTSEFALNLI